MYDTRFGPYEPPCPCCGAFTLVLRGFEKPTILCDNNGRQGCYGKFVISNSIDDTLKAIKADYNKPEYFDKRMAALHGIKLKQSVTPSGSGEFDFY